MIALRSRLMTLFVVALGLMLNAASPSRADDEFHPLFNGKDLSGWVPVNVAPETFTARDGMIVSTGKPMGILRTERPYENFILEPGMVALTVAAAVVLLWLSRRFFQHALRSYRSASS